MAQKADLLSIPTLVESPFIIVNIGGVTFGSYTSKNKGNHAQVTYPNFMNSLTITKINGAVNVYSLKFTYQVGFGEDPNLMDKILSKASKDRKITLQYGDWNAPAYIYKEESAIITKVTTNLNMNNSSIEYTVECTGDTSGINSVSFNFPARVAKPSDVIVSMLSTNQYGLQDVFKGMKNISKVRERGWIASNDKPVGLTTKKNTTPLNYLNYLVSCMMPLDASKASTYKLSIHEDYDKLYGGIYFKITEVTDVSNVFISTDTYEVDVNFPDDNLVTQFSLKDDQSWAILYDYADTAKQEEYVYRIDDEGNLVTEYSPTMVRSKKKASTSAYKSAWWEKMTQFPIEATLVIKGLVRPTILMSYVKVNVWFHGGQKHVSSGLYIITKQVDQIDSNGYKTTLSLLRVGGDS